MEDDADEAHRRFRAAVSSLFPFGLPDDVKTKLAENILFVDLLGAGHVGLEVLGEQILKTSAKAGGVGLVIVDPLARVLPPDSDINRQADAASVITMLDQIAVRANASVMFAHHTNKAAVRDGTQLSGGSSTGSQQLEDLSRYVIALKTLSGTEIAKYGIADDKAGYVELRLVKGNYQPPQEGPVIFRRGAGGALNHVGAKSKDQVADETMLSVLAECLSGIDREEWESIAGERGIGLNRARASRTRLERGKRVSVETKAKGKKLYRPLAGGARHS
jgi:RecA-family ATPase